MAPTYAGLHKKASKGKGSKGKSKDGKGTPKKLSRKEKKIIAKYGSVQAEDQYGKESSIVGMRRDELQWIVERLREQVQVNREERIKFQLERDFLYDVMQTYWKKYRCLKIEQEKKIADTNQMHQDADDNKIIKSIEGKHFRYEAQMNCTAMDVRDEIRKNRLKAMLERSWQIIALDIEDMNDLLARNAEKYRQKIADTRDKLDELQKYIDDHAAQLKALIKDLNREMENSLKLFHLTRRMEFQQTEERWSEFIWKLSRNFELQYDSMKNYYNDATHSNLTLVFTLQDWMNDSVERMNMYHEQTAEYEKLMTDAHIKMPALKSEYGRRRVKHDFITRTKQGIKTTKKEIVITQNAVNMYKGEYRQLLNQLNSINAERDHLKTNCEELIANVIERYQSRYEMQKEEIETTSEINRYWAGKQKFQNYFPTPEAYTYSVTPYKTVLDRKDEQVEKRRLTCMRVQKQSEDLRSSLEARLLRVGLKKKHATETPEQELILGRSTRLDWGPANLVAKNAYPKPSPFVEKFKCPKIEDETLIKICYTDSIRGFLAWKNKTKMDKSLQHRENSELY